ncbi:MAG: hypothetical protein IJD19_02580 [Ruminococcus sp.]|nr:hypothetical protein [Ruminococcus sp.]
MTKKLISVLLAVVMVLGMGTVALVSVSADLASLPEVAEGCNRYFFYMPEIWKNDYAYTAGIYWWSGTGAHTTWPGQAAEEADVPGVYYCDVPTDVGTIIWNNFIDGGTDKTLDIYTAAVQTKNIGCEYYEPGESDLYPEGNDGFDGMIYVTDMNQVEINDFSGKMTFAGEWYYYYGDGKYGTSPVEGESEIFTDPGFNYSDTLPTEPVGTEDETTPTETLPVEPSETQPTTETTTVETEPTTEKVPVETQPAVKNTVTLNDGTEYVVTVGDKLTYTVDLTAGRLFENIQAIVNYDAEMLQLTRIKSDDPDVEDWEVEGPAFCPNLEGVILNAGTEGVVKFNASKVAGYNFKEEKNLVTLEFTVVADGNTAIDLVVEEMTIKGGDDSYFAGGQAVITDGLTLKQAITGNTVPVVTEPTTEKTEPTTEKTEPTTEKTEPTTEKTEPTTGKVEPTQPKPTVTQPKETDVDSSTGATEKPVDTPPTGAATYVYVVFAVLAMAACAVVVLRKKVNG